MQLERRTEVVVPHLIRANAVERGEVAAPEQEVDCRRRGARAALGERERERIGAEVSRKKPPSGWGARLRRRITSSAVMIRDDTGVDENRRASPFGKRDERRAVNRREASVYSTTVPELPGADSRRRGRSLFSSGLGVGQISGDKEGSVIE